MPELGMRRGIPLRAYIAYTHAHCRKERFYMKTKKFVSALASMTIAAGMLSAFAVTASAQEVTLSYEKDGETLSNYTYTSASNDTYTLTQAGQDALANAKAGDTVTVTYNINANSASRYRAGLNFINHQFYINAVTSSTLQSSQVKAGDVLGRNRQFNNTAHECHFNVAFDNTNPTAEVEYVIELNAGGTVAAVTPTVKFQGYTLSYGKNTDPVANSSLNELTLNTKDRKNTDSDTAPTLTNFSAVLDTSYEEPPTPEDGPTEATEYTPKEYVGEDKGYTVDLDVTQADTITWYVKQDDSWTEITNGEIAKVSVEDEEEMTVTCGLIITGAGSNVDEYTFGAEASMAE